MPGSRFRNVSSASTHGEGRPWSRTTPTRSGCAPFDAPSLKGNSRVEKSGNRFTRGTYRRLYVALTTKAIL